MNSWDRRDLILHFCLLLELQSLFIMKITVIIALALMLISSLACTDRSNCFLKKLFDFNYPEENVYNISLSYNSNSLNNRVLGYGDFNNDLYADYVAVDENNSLLFFYYQNQGDSKGLYILNNTIAVYSGCNPESLYLYDINFDGLLDVTVWGTFNASNNCLYPLQQNINGGFDTTLEPLPFPATTQPIIFESGVGLPAKTTFLLLFNSLQESRKLLYFYLGTYTYSNWTNLFNNQNEAVPFSDQHWNSFIDLTDDCYPDFVFTNSNNEVQFWVWTPSIAKYNLTFTLDLKAGQFPINSLTTLAFSDLNYDGQQDLILGNSSLLLVYKSSLSASTDFCVAGKTRLGFNFNAPEIFSPPEGCTISEQNIQIGDLNSDGYPDMLFSCQINNNVQIIAYKNIFDKSEGFELFTVYQNAINQYISQLNVTQLSLFDVLENGILDMLVTVNNSHTVVLYNNYLYQNYFYIKGFGTNGETSEAGTQIPGATFYWLNSLGNSQRIAIYSQMYQTAYGAVPMPYVLTGLGRANNYVEQFTLGRLGLSRSWSPIIPNSQLAVFSGSSQTDNWQIKIFITPTDSIVYVLIVCIVILAILGSVLAVLKCRTKKQQNLLLADVM